MAAASPTLAPGLKRPLDTTPDLSPNNNTSAQLDTTAPPHKKRFKASDLPLTSTQRSTLETLLHTFKKRGEFDSLRKKVFASFDTSASKSTLISSLTDLAEAEVEKNPMLLSKDRRQAAPLVEGAAERSGCYKLAEEAVDEIIEGFVADAAAEALREIRRQDVGDELLEAEEKRGGKSDEEYAAKVRQLRLQRERRREEERVKELEKELERRRKVEEERKRIREEAEAMEAERRKLQELRQAEREKEREAEMEARRQRQRELEERAERKKRQDMQWERERQEKEERERQQKKRKLMEKSGGGDKDIDTAALEELIEEGKRMANKSNRGEAVNLTSSNPSDTPRKHHHHSSVSAELKSANGVSATPRQETALEAIMRKEKHERMLSKEGGDKKLDPPKGPSSASSMSPYPAGRALQGDTRSSSAHQHERDCRDSDYHDQHLAPHPRNDERNRSRSDRDSSARSLHTERSRHDEGKDAHRGRDDEEPELEVAAEKGHRGNAGDRRSSQLVPHPHSSAVEERDNTRSLRGSSQRGEEADDKPLQRRMSKYEDSPVFDDYERKSWRESRSGFDKDKRSGHEKDSFHRPSGSRRKSYVEEYPEEHRDSKSHKRRNNADNERPHAPPDRPRASRSDDAPQRRSSEYSVEPSRRYKPRERERERERDNSPPFHDDRRDSVRRRDKDYNRRSRYDNTDGADESSSHHRARDRSRSPPAGFSPSHSRHESSSQHHSHSHAHHRPRDYDTRSEHPSNRSDRRDSHTHVHPSRATSGQVRGPSSYSNPPSAPGNPQTPAAPASTTGSDGKTNASKMTTPAEIDRYVPAGGSRAGELSSRTRIVDRSRMGDAEERGDRTRDSDRDRAGDRDRDRDRERDRGSGRRDRGEREERRRDGRDGRR
ncbi:MAG: hypothetical protein M1831_007570 [Alyxoria varia]|nr:MAG: hypothetical protein M1831_007570 [Alyxoria varia]